MCWQEDENLKSDLGKICIDCDEEKPIYEFPYYPSRKKYERYCKICARKREHRKKSRNPSLYRGHKLKRRYDISSEQYDELFQKQGGVCAICGKPERTKSKDGITPISLVVDHTHDGTKTVRGLLCTHCNFCLGHLFDRPKLAIKIANYLLGPAAIERRPSKLKKIPK